MGVGLQGGVDDPVHREKVGMRGGHMDPMVEELVCEDSSTPSRVLANAERGLG